MGHNRFDCFYQAGSSLPSDVARETFFSTNFPSAAVSLVDSFLSCLAHFGVSTDDNRLVWLRESLAYADYGIVCQNIARERGYSRLCEEARVVTSFL